VQAWQVAPGRLPGRVPCFVAAVPLIVVSVQTFLKSDYAQDNVGQTLMSVDYLHQISFQEGSDGHRILILQFNHQIGQQIATDAQIEPLHPGGS